MPDLPPMSSCRSRWTMPTDCISSSQTPVSRSPVASRPHLGGTGLSAWTTLTGCGSGSFTLSRKGVSQAHDSWPKRERWPITDPPDTADGAAGVGVGTDAVLPDLPGALDRAVRLERRHLDADRRRAMVADRPISVAGVAGADRLRSAHRGARLAG